MRYITTGDAARICKVGINTIKRWIKQGELTASVTPGGRWRIAAHEFVPFLKEHDIPVPAELLHVEPRILIIDDEPSACRLLTAALGNAEFPTEVHCVHDSYDGMVKIGQLQPQLLVLDILMPKINGLELLRRLRLSADFNRQMRVLVVTGARDDKALMRQLKEIGPDAVLFKPVDIRAFVDTARQLLGEGIPARPG